MLLSSNIIYRGEYTMTPPDRLRALLAEPGFVVMPAVWDGLSAKLAFAAGFKTAFLSGSCVAASRLGGPDLDLISFAEMFDSFNMVRGAAPDSLILADGDHGYGNAMNVQRTVRAYGRAGAAAILGLGEGLGRQAQRGDGRHRKAECSKQFLHGLPPVGHGQKMTRVET